MATTNFVDGQTVIEAAWLNDVDEAIYNPASITLPATSVSTTAISGISATDVQGVLAEIVAEKQPLDNELTALATSTAAADKIPYFTGTTTAGTLTWNSASALAAGATTISSNTVIKAAIDAMDIDTQVAPSTSGNVLTSNGTIWTSTAKVTRDTVKTLSSTGVSFTGIPTGVTRITIVLYGASLSGTDSILVQLGVGGVAETTSYVSTSVSINSSSATSGSNSTAGMLIIAGGGSTEQSVTMSLYNITGNIWVTSHAGKQTTTNVVTGGGHKSLAGVLDSIFITRTGTDTFDAGTVNIIYD